MLARVRNAVAFPQIAVQDKDRARWDRQRLRTCEERLELRRSENGHNKTLMQY
jgi:hypothetical protein